MLEINVRNLIAHCEELAKEEPTSWRLKKYIKSLDTMIDELQSSDHRPCTTAIDEYFTRTARVKKAINYVPESPPRSRKLKLRSTINNNGNAASSGETMIREINQIDRAAKHSNLRSELLGSEDGTDGGRSQLRRRAAAAATAASGDGAGGGQAMGQAMKYYDDVQERIAEDMLQLTQSLREQTETANRIIRRDTEVVATAAQMSDRNLSSLGREAEKLDEHTKRAWKCWMWLMIGFVMVIFIFMVMFMKIMKKKS